MNNLDTLNYNKEMLVEDNFKYGYYKESLYLSKSYFANKEFDQYFLKLFYSLPNNSRICQG